MKVLFVGDPHVTVDALNEASSLIDLVHQSALEYNVDKIVFLGDLHQNHSTLRVEVLAFWKRAFDKLSRFKILALVGNHDLSNSGQEHALLAYNINVIDKPIVEDGVLFVPFMPDKNEFIKACNSFDTANVLVCHQSFYGARYESGHNVDDGVDQKEIPQNIVISGHIHTPQTLGKVLYVGSPRWRTLSDAGCERYLYIGNPSEPSSFKRIPTKTHCREIIHLEDKESSPININDFLNNEADIRVDVFGNERYLSNRVPELENAGFKIRTFKTDISVLVRESDGIWPAFVNYRLNFIPTRNTSLDKLAELTEHLEEK